MTLSITSDQKSVAKQFVDLVISGTQSLLEAGQILAKAIDDHGEGMIEIICERCPDMTPEFVKRLEAVGRKLIHPSLVINESPGVRRLRSLPYSYQEKYNSNPIPLLILDGDGIKTISADVRNLTPAQAAQVFARDHVRSEAEQRTFLESKKAVAIASPASFNPPYRVVQNHLVIMTPCKLTRKELASLLAQMA